MDPTRTPNEPAGDEPSTPEPADPRQSVGLAVTRAPAVAYLAPLVLFLALGYFEALLPSGWYPAFYALKVGLVAALWWTFRRYYPAFSQHGIAWGVIAGVVGCAVWIGLAGRGFEAQFLPSWLAGMLSQRVGFDPFTSIESIWGRSVFIAVRLFGLAVVVPLMEEIAWRGFLWRWLIDEQFERVPQGQWSLRSFVVVTLLFTLAHPELLAALVWGAGINALYCLTRNLWACIVAHAVTNLLLGMYVLSTGSWHLW